MELKKLLSDFRIDSETVRQQINDKTKDPLFFKDIAECMLSGHFLVTSKSKKVIVRPTVLEFYYHEEAPDGVKDFIVYHKNTKNKKDDKGLIPCGFLHNHVSGIDLTFEHENGGKVRASILIRSFKIETDGQEQKAAMKAYNINIDENDERSTGLYSALFGIFSVFDGFNIEWVDGNEPIHADWHVRQNVCQYKDETRTKIPGTQCTRKWQARNIELAPIK